MVTRHDIDNTSSGGRIAGGFRLNQTTILWAFVGCPRGSYPAGAALGNGWIVRATPAVDCKTSKSVLQSGLQNLGLKLASNSSGAPNLGLHIVPISGTQLSAK